MNDIWCSLHRKTSPRYSSIFHRLKEVNALANALIFLRFTPRAQIKPETVEKLHLHPLGTNVVTSLLCV